MGQSTNVHRSRATYESDDRTKMKLKGAALAVLCVGIQGKSLIKQLKDAHKAEHGNLKQLKADFGSIDEIKNLKREWQMWKKTNKKNFSNEVDFMHFKNFLENKLEIIKEKDSHNHHHTNMTTNGPYSDLTNAQFQNEGPLMKKQHKKNRRAKRDLYYAESGPGSFPFEVPEWIKECAPSLSCGLEDIEFSWECIEKVFTPAQVEAARAMDGNSRVDYTTSTNPANKPLVTPVKDQGMCGSCWSFAATGQLESLMLKHDKVGGNMKGGSNDADPSVWWGLSEQQLIDCSSGREARRRMGPFINHACDGGWPPNAFIHEQVFGGMMDSVDYPYQSGYTYEPADFCAFDSEMNVMADRTKQCYMTPQDDEDQLMAAVYHHGAVTIVVDSGGIDWQLYQGGIAHPRDCSSEVLNHAVLLVGYGTEESTGEDYWIIRNSWGSWWGEGGYMKLAKNSANLCGVASMGNFVTYETYTQY